MDFLQNVNFSERQGMQLGHSWERGWEYSVVGTITRDGFLLIALLGVPGVNGACRRLAASPATRRHVLRA